MKTKTMTLLILSLLTCGVMAEGKHKNNHKQYRQEYRQEQRHHSPRVVVAPPPVVVTPRPWYNLWYRPRPLPQPVYVAPRPRPRVYVAPPPVYVAPRPWYVVIWPW